MNILQISAPKTGSFWLHTILKNILDTDGAPRHSYIKNLEIYQDLQNQQLSFKGQAGVDMLDIEDTGCYFRVSSLVKRPIEDLADYAKKVTLAWTHSTYCRKTPKIFPLFDRKVCIIRDPRDRALSVAKFAFTPYMKKHYPSPYESPAEYLEANFDKLMDQWVWFYGNYLLHRDSLGIYFVFYENLLHFFPEELDKLLSYLDINIQVDQKKAITENASFFNMKSKSPRHLHKGKSRKWVNGLSGKQQKRAIEKAGFLMEVLGYPHSHEKPTTFFGLPTTLPEKELLKQLKTINWKALYSSSLEAN